MSTLLLNIPQTEILATPLQYRTCEEIMYEILSDVPPPNQNPGTAHQHIYNLVDVIVSHVNKVNTEITMLVVIQKIKQAKLTMKKFYFDL